VITSSGQDLCLYPSSRRAQLGAEAAAVRVRNVVTWIVGLKIIHDSPICCGASSPHRRRHGLRAMLLVAAATAAERLAPGGQRVMIIATGLLLILRGARMTPC
jgi:hypothetical protein